MASKRKACQVDWDRDVLTKQRVISLETLSTKTFNGKFYRAFASSITNHSFEKPAVTFERFSQPVIYSLFPFIIVTAMEKPFCFSFLLIPE